MPYELEPSTLVLHQPVCTVSVGLPAAVSSPPVPGGAAVSSPPVPGGVAVSSPPVPGGAAVSSPPVPGGVGQRCSMSVGQTTLMTLQDEGR